MTGRERFQLALQHKEPDRVPIHDSPWGATVERWHHEGLPDFIGVDEYFGYELAGFGFDISPRFPTKVLERNQTYIIETTAFGGLRKNFRDYSTTPEIIDWAVKSREDWENIKPRLMPDETRVDWSSLYYSYHRAKEEGKFLTLGGSMGYDLLQSYMKSEELLIAIAVDPEWVADMVKTHAELLIAMSKMIIDKGYKFDGAFLYNDMGYRNASLFSPEAYKRTHLESDAMVCEFYHSKNMPVILHSCGNVKALIPYLIEAGFDCLQPLEVKAGMDLIELKSLYGDKLSFMGGIDVRLMAAQDPALIEEEIAKKFQAAKPGGGYIYHSDHSIPKDVSFEQYCRVIELVKKYGKY